jgi:predicted amidohydrolase
VRLAEPVDGPTIAGLSALAAELGVHLLVGSFHERSDEPHRCYNTSVLLGPDGAVLGTYRKMHLFDVDHSDAVRFSESATCKPGEAPAVVRTALGTIGLSICYDLRFPELFRAEVASAKLPIRELCRLQQHRLLVSTSPNRPRQQSWLKVVAVPRSASALVPHQERAEVLWPGACRESTSSAWQRLPNRMPNPPTPEAEEDVVCDWPCQRLCLLPRLVPVLRT